jgi:hypothetical protein
MKAEEKAYLVKMMFGYFPYNVVIFAKTEKGARGKAKRKFPEYDIVSVSYVFHC